MLLQVTETDPIEVTVGEAPPIVVASGVDWPRSLHECLVPCEVLPLEGEAIVKVKVQQSEATVTLRGV